MDRWSGHQVSRVDYDAELRKHNEILRRAYGIGPHDQVLDIGCGVGQTTRDAARLAVAGSVLGVDVSAPMIERARRLTEAAGLPNVTFEQADAEIHHFPAERFDVAISRFGTMFFADPVAAFTNIGRAIRPNGRLVMMVWQNHDLNEWSVSIQRALADVGVVPTAALSAPDPFSLADPTTTAQVLETAGFGEAAFTGVHQPVYYGPDIAAALEWVSGFSCVNDVLQRLDPASTERARAQLRQTLAAHASGGSLVRLPCLDRHRAAPLTAAFASPPGNETRVIMQIRAHAIREKGGKAEPFLYERALGSHDVLVRITHCSIARDDIQYMDNDWGDTRFPLVAGHEIVGIVEEVGADVADLQRGDRVGIGYQQEACFDCSFCDRAPSNSAPARRSLPSTATAAWPSTSSSMAGSPSGSRRSSIRPTRSLCSRPASPYMRGFFRPDCPTALCYPSVEMFGWNPWP